MSDVTIVREGWLQKRGKYIQYLSSSTLLLPLPLFSLFFFSAFRLDWGPGRACPHVPVGGCVCLRLSASVITWICDLLVWKHKGVLLPHRDVSLWWACLAVFAEPVWTLIRAGAWLCACIQLITSTWLSDTLLFYTWLLSGQWVF